MLLIGTFFLVIFLAFVVVPLSDSDISFGDGEDDTDQAVTHHQPFKNDDWLIYIIVGVTILTAAIFGAFIILRERNDDFVEEEAAPMTDWEDKP